MRWEDREGSTNVEDRRGRRGGGLALRGTGGLLLFAVVLVAGYYGVDLTPLLSQSQTQSPADGGGAYTPSPEEEELARFTSVVLKTTEDTWAGIFRDMGRTYTPPRLVLYSGATDTACGYGDSATGPFYCPRDQTVYIDLSFYRELKERLGGGGDFAQGYVIAHEVGHHVQHLLGTDEQTQRRDNRFSVRLELQADAYAGIWGRTMQREGIMEPGDLEEALRTAAAIGDDRLQQQSTGRVVPDSFTHGTSEQRLYWFRRGFDTGDLAKCDTFTEMR